MTFEEQNKLILERASIVDVISDYVDLKRKGNNYVCKCPFHNEKSGSFTVFADTNKFNCFGCNKHGNAFDFVMEYLHVDFVEARNIIANKCGVLLSDVPGYRKPESMMERATPQDHFSFEKKEFTKFELSILGPKVTPEVCKEFNLVSVHYFVREKNHKGESWKVSSTAEFPIFIYDFGTWGKIYQPLSADYRFSYFGEVPESFIFGTRKVRELIEAKKRGKLPDAKPASEDMNQMEDDYVEDTRLESLVICSGGSDAMNLRAETKHHVCYLNSETAELTDYEYKQLLRPIVRDNQLYVLYDLDDTGEKRANELGLRFIDLKIVHLPSDLVKFRDRKGKPCKDVKDFFQHYKHPRYSNKSFLIDNIIKTSLPLRFWDTKYDKDGKFTGYDINNLQLYGFLAGLGVYRLPNEQSKKTFVYIHEQNKIIKVIPDEGLQSYVNELLIRYLNENLDYWSVNLINTIHRSNQVKIGSLEKLHLKDFDFKSFGKDFDFLFFRNTAVRITKQGVESFPYSSVNKYTYETKILDFDFRVLDAPFKVEYTKEYRDAKIAFEAASKTDANYKMVKNAYECFDPMKQYTVEIYDKSFSTLQYVYNTGRTHWRKEESGITLSQHERDEQNLHFVNKVMALGYLMFRFKDDSRPYMVYGMETDLNDLGTHMGGTGKSMFFELVAFVRSLFPVDGQTVKKDADETMFGGVHKGITDFIYFDDLHKNVDLHRFMPMATGNMIVRNLYENRIVLPYDESPKVAFSSNHGLDKFDNSLRRRTWFTGFSSYYHAEDQSIGLPERSPRTEFGYNIPKDYTDKDMNRFYNFMAYCLHTYIKFGVRVNPPMDSLEKRMVQRNLGDAFLWWADEYLEGKLNTNISRNELFEDWKAGGMSENTSKNVSIASLKKKMIEYCKYHKYIFNPADLLKTDNDKTRGEIRTYKDYKEVYCWHIRTADQQELIDNKDNVEF